MGLTGHSWSVAENLPLNPLRENLSPFLRRIPSPTTTTIWAGYCDFAFCLYRFKDESITGREANAWLLLVLILLFCSADPGTEPR